MARDLDRRQQADLTAFVNAVADAAGYTTTAEWARESGYPASNLSNLRNGRGGVDGYNLLRLIRAAGSRIQASPEQLALGIALGIAEVDDAESIARRLDEIAALVTEALEELRARPAQPAARQQAAATPRTPAKKAAR